MNDSWSLPAAVTGSIQFVVGQVTKTFDVGDNTDTMIEAGMETEAALVLFAAMDKSASMAVTVGKSKPIVASLAGSTKATNAFRTCAHLQSNSPSTGSDPFAPS